jgi:hypothetical protein
MTIWKRREKGFGGNLRQNAVKAFLFGDRWTATITVQSCLMPTVRAVADH